MQSQTRTISQGKDLPWSLLKWTLEGYFERQVILMSYWLVKAFEHSLAFGHMTENLDSKVLSKLSRLQAIIEQLSSRTFRDINFNELWSVTIATAQYLL